VPGQERQHQEEQLRLTAVQVTHRIDKEPDVAVLPAQGRGRRVLARAGEIRAIGRTLDFSQPLGAATDGANLLTQRRARAARFLSTAERTFH